jgi:hypothetical protein
MSKSLHNCHHSEILAYFHDPVESTLDEKLKIILQRWITARRLMDKYPDFKIASKIFKFKYPDLSDRQVYYDFANARRMLNGIDRHEKEWIRRWIINDIFNLIDAAKALGSKGFDAWIAAQANLIKAAGLNKKKEIEIDPEILEAHTFYMIINVSGQKMEVDFDYFESLPAATTKQLSDTIFNHFKTKDIASDLTDDCKQSRQ